MRNEPKSWSTGAQQLCPATPLELELRGSALLTPCWGLRLLSPSSPCPPRPAVMGTDVWCSSISRTPEVSLPPLFSRCMSCCHSSYCGQPERSHYGLKQTPWACTLLNGTTGRPLKMTQHSNTIQETVSAYLQGWIFWYISHQAGPKYSTTERFLGKL